MPTTRIRLHRPATITTNLDFRWACYTAYLMLALLIRSCSQYLLRGPKAIEPRQEFCVPHDVLMHSLRLAANISGQSGVLA